MKEVTQNRKKPITAPQLVKIIVFLVVTALIFQFLTLLYDRPKSYRLYDYENLPENTVDAVVIGASTVYRYYDSMEAWEKYGISSYAYGIAGAVGENTIFSLKDLLKHQSPKVALIEVRGFLGSRSMNGMTTNMYRYIKNYANPFKRWEILNHYNKMTGIRFSSDQLPYYLTLIMNHENYWRLFDSSNWKRVIKGGKRDFSAVDASQFMGYAIGDRVVPQSAIPYDEHYQTKLAQGGENALREVLDYCRKIGQEVILVASPYAYTQDDMGELNAVTAIAQEYNVPFLNANKDQEKLGIDFSTDYYDAHHTNLLGAVKYTDYLLDYLTQHYQFTDHRGDEAYVVWEQEDAQYRPAKEAALASLDTQIQAAAAGQETGEEAAGTSASDETNSGNQTVTSAEGNLSDDEED